jgi:hypothetical protein
MIYLKLSKIDSRFIRLAILSVAAFASGGIIMGLPINGDVGL